jgi:hypothetical protein
VVKKLHGSSRQVTGWAFAVKTDADRKGGVDDGLTPFPLPKSSKDQGLVKVRAR